MPLLRKSIQMEKLYEASAAGILQKQHDRLLNISEAFIQASGWMRAQDLTDEESEMCKAAQNLIDSHKKDIKVG